MENIRVSVAPENISIKEKVELIVKIFEGKAEKNNLELKLRK